MSEAIRKVYVANYSLGILISAILHVSGGLIAALLLTYHASKQDFQMQQVFSVTLEGGEKLGGISQVPTDSKAQKIKAVPNALKETTTAKEETAKTETTKAKEEVTKKAEPTEKEAEIKAPTAVEEAEKKKKEEEQKKKVEDEKKKVAEEQKKKAEEDKKKAEEEKKKADEEEKAAEKKEKDDREKKLRQAIARMKNQAGSEEGGVYDGESANAGGTGIGAAALGGKGMGGGTLASIEFIAYRNSLENHIKQGWRWMEGGKRLRAQVIMQISPSGVIDDAKVVGSSGNSYFDDSVLRAVQKASPVPVPPEKLYEQFKEVRITFDSQE